MEKLYEKIVITIISVLLILLLFSNIRLCSTQRNLRRTESELGLIRAELSNAQNRESELTATVGNIRDITERADKILNESGNTIQSIREKISLLEEYFSRINLYLSTNCNNDNNNSDSEE